ncbi:hypothetical protein [Streptococcus sp. HF-1907]|uniref:hypothetical protein n=1 Tax=Streptococcus sp. HF-1907 TaxID=2785793 RepID=UPI001E44E078|nr:hypothetical protein [Streptococcus sp. HF-1907]
MLDWKSLLEPYKKPLLEDLDGLLRIPSVKNVETVSDQAPFGQGIADTLQYMLDLGDRDGFTSKNIQGYAGRISLGQGTESLVILSHLDVVPADPTNGKPSPSFLKSKMANLLLEVLLMTRDRLSWPTMPSKS